MRLKTARRNLLDSYRTYIQAVESSFRPAEDESWLFEPDVHTLQDFIDLVERSETAWLERRE